MRGQIEAVGKQFYNLDVLVEIVREEIVSTREEENNCRSCSMHVVMELRFDNAKAYQQSLANSANDGVPESTNNYLEVCPADLELTQLFPFHILFASDMQIQSTGKILATILPELVDGDVREAFILKQPPIEFSWEQVRKIYHCQPSLIGQKIAIEINKVAREKQLAIQAKKL